MTKITQSRHLGHSKNGKLRRAVMASGLLALIAAAITAGTAVASGSNPFSALTGKQITPTTPNAQAIGTGQQLAMGASNDVPVGLSLTKDINFAPGYESWKAQTIAFQLGLTPGSPPAGHAFMSSSALRWQVAESAACSWLDYYVTSATTSDKTAAATAAGQIAAVPDSSAITGLDYPSQLGSAVAAAGAGDPSLVKALIDTGQAGNCTAVGPFPPASMSTTQVKTQLAAARVRGERVIAADPVAHRLAIIAVPHSRTR